MRFTAAALLCLLSITVAAQSAKSNCKSNPKDPACVKGQVADPVTSNGSAVPSSGDTGKPLNQQFPFPVEQSRHGGDAENGLPALPRGTDKDPPASSRGDKLPALPSGADADPPDSSNRPLRLPPASGSSSSSSTSDEDATSSGTSQDDDSDVAPTKAAADAPVKASALKDLGSRGSTSEARARLELTRLQDDLKVGAFYLKDGNAQGAYLRFKDAVDHAPEEPEARFGLAEAAGKLNKRDEAMANYREYLKLDAGGDHDKQSRKALEKLGAGTR